MLRLAHPVTHPSQVNLTSENLQPIKPGTQLDFSYSVKWVPTTKDFANRFKR